jgi:glutathione S-transferase
MPFLVMTLVNDSKSYLLARRPYRICASYSCQRHPEPNHHADVRIKAIRNSPPFFVRPITGIVASQVEAAFLTRNIESNLAFLEQQLQTAPDGGPYLCGKDLTAADILMSFPIIAASGRVLKDKKQKDKYPLLAAYAKRLEEADGYKKAVVKIEQIEGHFSASM